MRKTVTLRLDEESYRLFQAFAVADRRPLSNLIETAALKHLEECLFADDSEMKAIRADKERVGRLRRGSQAAKARKGRFVD